MKFVAVLVAFIASSSCNHTDPTAQKFLRESEDVVQDIALAHVNVIDMEHNTVLLDKTILIKNSTIEAIHPGSYTIPETYFVIDAPGSYLMPGLADMHTHIWYEEDLLPYVANGITTVLNMGGPASILQFRAKAANKEIIAPTIFASGFVDGPGSRGWFARTPEEAEEAVREIKSAGWNFIKAYNNIPADAYETLLAKAKEQKIAVVGHGVRSIGMPGILSSGQVMIAHAEEYLYTFFNNTTDDSKIPEAVQITKAAGAYVTPNLCTYETIAKQWGNPSALQQMLSREEMKFVSPKWKDNFWKQFDFTSRNGSINTQYAFLKRFTKSLHDGGVPLLLGSDTPFMIGQVHGFAIHDDIRNLMECGLTPGQALMVATQNASDFITTYVPGTVPFGQVKEGYKADLVLLNSNPLGDREALRDRIGVMINGRWLSEKKLSEEMEKLAKNLK